MSDSPAGVEPRVSVAELARAAGYDRTYIYSLAKQAPDLLPLDRRGVPLSAALAWLKSNSRTAREAKRAEALRQLRETMAAVVQGGRR